MGLGIKSYLKLKYREATGKEPGKFEGHYRVWRAKRIQAILDQYGHRFFEAKSVLELGAGYAAIGAFFGLLGADVTCVEGRAGNTKTIEKRFPFLQAITHDLTNGWPPGKPFHDVIIHMGVLYHLANPEPTLREACRRCNHLILETEVADSDDPLFIKNVGETKFRYDQAVDGVGSRPSPAWVERIMLEEGLVFSRISDGRCNSEHNQYDWPVKNTQAHRHGQRRMWFAERKN